MEELKALYEKYLQFPLATVTTPSVIYDRGHVVIEGLSFIHPHPHRHYTFEEFVNAYNEKDQRLKNYLS